MTLKECYEVMHGDYADMLRRLSSEERVRRLLLMFPRDTSFAQLEAAMEARDYTAAFRAVHSLKGVTLNLSISQLAQSAIALTEALRSGMPPENIDELFADVKKDYHSAITAIEALRSTNQ